MTEQADTFSRGIYLQHMQGSVNLGPGNQYIFASPQTATRGSSRRAISRHHVLWLRQRFVEPPGMAPARETLRATSTVLLSGRPGSGRRTAAMMLLSELPSESGQFHELTADDGDDPLDSQPVRDGDRLLLDLSLFDEQRYGKAQGELAGLLPHLRDHGAHLVVVLPDQPWPLLREELSRHTKEMGRPPHKALLLRYLRLESIYPDQSEMTPTRLTEVMDAAPAVRTLDAFVRLVTHARSRGGRTDGFTEWRGEALTALLGRSSDVARDIAAHDGGRRALCLSAAMLHGGSPDEVFKVNTALLAELQQPEDERPRLDRADLTQRFADIKAAANHDSVQFTSLAYDTAVRAHFWSYYPDVRPQLRDWVGKSVKLDLTPAARSVLVAHFAEQCLRTDRYLDLITLVGRWTRAGEPEELRWIACGALEHGLRHERYGGKFRRAIYLWSLDTRLPEALVHVLIEVCSKVMALRHPDQALVRLHHLARRARGLTGRTAREALLGLVQDDDRLWLRLLDRVTYSLEHHAFDRDSELFLLLADPGPLTGTPSHSSPVLESPEVRAQLTACWGAVLGNRPKPAWEPYAARWLTAASDSARHREQLLDILLDACDRDVTALSRLHVVTRDWAAGSRTGHHPDREDPSARVARLFSAKVRVALGLGPATTRTP